jgi:hypothetical protein
MSLPAQNVAPQAVANPGQTVFPFVWRCDDPTTVKVWVNDAQDGGFAVALNADQTATPGGSITRAVPCVGGEVVTVERTSPQTQTTNLVRYGPFPADTVTNLMDRMTMLLQEVAGVAIGKAVKAARASMARFSSLELPAPVNGRVLGYADGGGGLSKLDLFPLATGLNWRGDFNIATSYVFGDAVAYLGGSYVLYVDATVVGVLPTDATKWALLAAKGAVGGNRRYAWLGRNYDVDGVGASIPTVTNTKLTFAQHKESDVVNDVGTDNVSRLTAKQSGQYRIRATVLFGNGAVPTGTSAMNLYVAKNGAANFFNFGQVVIINTWGSNWPGQISGECVADLLANDFIEMYGVPGVISGSNWEQRSSSFSLEHL